MIFNTDQIQHILSTVDLNFKFLAAEILGIDVLSEQDKSDLQLHGFDLKVIESSHPNFLQAYHWGKLSQLIGEINAKNLDYENFSLYLRHGQYIPLSPWEEFNLSAAKRRTYSHITGLGEGIKKDITNQIGRTEQERRVEYEKIIKEELEDGAFKRKSLTSIVSELGHKTEDWERNFGRIVDTEMNNIFQEGRAAQIKQKFGDSAKVYKDVFEKACRHCLNAYLTNGVGSQPRIFDLKELENNGDNIGLKVADWKPVLGGMHPFCRCQLFSLLPGQTWDNEKQRFMYKKSDEPKKDFGVKAKIKVTVGKKYFEV